MDLKKGRYWDISISPVVGCCHPGGGCLSCWAASMAHRFRSSRPEWDGVTNELGRWNGKVNFNTAALARFLQGTNKVIACNWMGDLYQPAVPDWYIRLVLSCAASAAMCRHRVLLLTKFAARMHEIYATTKWHGGTLIPISLPSKGGRESHLITQLALPSSAHVEKQFPPRNIWWGASICNQKEAQAKLPHLMRMPSPRWVSLEPMLSRVDIECWKDYIDWVAIGGEQGANARPLNTTDGQWQVDHCRELGIPVFFKQWGSANRKERKPRSDPLPFMKAI